MIWHRASKSGWPYVQVIRTFAVLAEQHRWQGLPHFALGGSSGGAFALHLALRLQLSGLCAQLMAVMPENLEAAPHPPGGSAESGWAYPPTAFVHMSRDERTAVTVDADVGVLKKQVGLIREYRID